ncbi:MAG TPA: FAD:protein FMN transferase [Candidatus Hydrogenedentes bacterium]|nr:FAD:protein FMN transferase [Candidatus Hydrogenedentota bacterium]
MRWLLWTLLLILLGCGCGLSGPQEYQFHGPTMGTAYTVKVVAAVSSKEAEQVGLLIRGVLASLEAKMSTWEPDSELSRFNQSQSTEPVAFSPEVVDVFRIAQEVSRQTEGAFDATVMPLVEAWGFGRRPAPKPPDESSLQMIREHVGYHYIEIGKDNRVRKLRPDIYCDFSALAPGYASDCIIRALEQRGIRRCMAEVGGEVRAVGMNAANQPWKIGILRPVSDETDIQRIVLLDNLSVSTSGDYREYHIREGKRWSHTIDPATGRPVEHPLASVSVLHRECAWADAYATALMVMGPEKGYDFAVRQGLGAYFIVHSETEGFVEKTTPAFDAAVK